MLTPWILKSLHGALVEQAVKAEAFQTLATGSLNTHRDILTLTDAPTEDPTWYPYAIMEYESGVARVLSGASVVNKTLSWNTPMWPDIDLPAEVTVKRGPLAGALVFMGGGMGVVRQGTITLTPMSTSQEPRAIGRDEHGSFAEIPSGLVVVEYSLPDSGPDAEEYETSFWNWLYLTEQVRAVLVSQDALPIGCRRVMLQPTMYSQFHQTQKWTLRADVPWYVDMRI